MMPRNEEQGRIMSLVFLFTVIGLFIAGLQGAIGGAVIGIIYHYSTKEKWLKNKKK